MKTEEYYGLNPEPLKEDGLNEEDLEEVKDILDKGNKELIDEINEEYEKNKEKLDKEAEELFNIEDPSERLKRQNELAPGSNYLDELKER